MKYIFKNYIKLSFAIFMLALGSCNEDFLDTEQRGVTSVSSFYETDEDALQAVMACYNHFQGDAFNWKVMIGNLSDDVYAGGGMRGDFSQWAEINEYTFGTSNSTLGDSFSFYFNGIYLTNLVINKIEPENELKQRAIAEAKSLRALFYFDLVTLWGPVPLVLTELTPSEYAQPNSTIEDIWAQIVQDLQDAITVLPLKSELASSELNRMTKGAAQAYLGKSFLFQEKYTEAIAQFETVIGSGEYDLQQDYSTLLKKDSEYGLESIFEITYDSNVSVSGESSPAHIFWGPRLTWFSPGGSGIMPGFGFQVPQKGLYDAFVEAGDQIRKQASILTEDELIAVGGSMRNSEGTLQYGSEGFVRLKYAIWMSETDMTNPYGAVGTNFRMMRYADILLMAAEAYNQAVSPNDEKARQYLNLVRNRAGLADLTSSGDALFEDIKNERRLELCFENKRYQDLVRWGDVETTLADQGHYIPKGDGTYYENSSFGYKSKHLLLPFPLTEINVNPNIVQNPGW